MKKSKFSEEQILFALKQADAGQVVGDVCRQMGISEATFYVWKKRYGNLGLPEVRELRQLQSLPATRLTRQPDRVSMRSEARKSTPRHRVSSFELFEKRAEVRIVRTDGMIRVCTMHVCMRRSIRARLR
jgi:hypothetical protein